MVETRIAWNCDFCKKADLTISLAEIIYCNNCKKSYGNRIQDFDVKRNEATLKSVLLAQKEGEMNGIRKNQ